MTIELPEMDKLFELIDEIYSLSLERSKLDVFIKTTEVEITLETSTNEKYFQNGKPPSQAYVENSYRYSGLDGELINRRLQLAEIENRISYLRTKLDFLKSVIDIWRTQAANERVVM